MWLNEKKNVKVLFLVVSWCLYQSIWQKTDADKITPKIIEY